ncbi:aldo/keto reductase [Olivibacter sp. XZL3]|uniref:aldo/keto reductase n=1 Tax=Olivibacter sp. XZL3 TaxID=1735116 RepID=UPI001065093B|nr:aldo/keto reductase [Olivibacter sp. XZL3]
MKYKLFSEKSGLRVSELSLGAGLTGHSKHTKQDYYEIFKTYADAGGRFIDTAEGYQAGKSESLIGEFVGSDRDDFIIASKYAVGRDRTEGFAKLGNSRKAMRVAIEQSLKRLNTDYIDLYWLHAYDGTTPIDEILRGLDDLVREGKILYGGLSNFPVWKIAYGSALSTFKNYVPITAISHEYSIAERTAEYEIIPMAEELGIGIGAWSPLGGGFLGRSIEHNFSHLPHWTESGRPNQVDITLKERLTAIAKEHNISVTQLAYVWLFHKARKSVTSIVPIAGVSSVHQMKEIIEAINLTLPNEVLSELDAFSSISPIEPHNHNFHHQQMTNGVKMFKIEEPQ